MRILFADDHPLFREGVKPVLKKLAVRVQIIEANDFPAAFLAARDNPDFDLALMDIYMPGMPGIDGIARFRASFPHIPIAVLSASDDRDQIQQLLANGALGYICKSSPSKEILNALKLILAGGVYIPPMLLAPLSADGLIDVDPKSKLPEVLTHRQLDVLRQVAQGLNNRQIAQNLGVTEGTIKIHVSSVFRTLKIKSRTEALLLAQKMGLGRPG